MANSSKLAVPLLAPAIFIVLLCASGDLSAQGQRQDNGNAGQIPGQDLGQVFQDSNQQGATGTDDGASAGSEASDGELESVAPEGLTFDILQNRNQGFVGATAELIQPEQQGFIGTPGQRATLAEEARSFQGGGINSGIGDRSATTSSSELSENGFTVSRKGIRSRLRQAFVAPRVPEYVTESRFQSRMIRQPVVKHFGQGVTVTVSNRTALLTGVVSSNAEREVIIRQLRLEPGVYGIVDQTSNAR